MEQEEVQEHEEQPNDPPEEVEPDGNEGEEAEEVEQDDPPGEQEPPKSVESDVERRAREKGWAPREEYTGRPENWVDAKEYLKSPPALRQERDTLAVEVQALKRNLELQGKSIEEIRREERERTLREIKTQQRRAAEEGDFDTFDKLDAERDKIARPEPEEKKDGQGEDKPEVREWVARNPWFNSDPALNMEAQAIHVRLQNKHPHMPLEENLQRVEDEIKRRYPDEFGIQPQEQKPSYRRAQKVSGTEARGASAKSGQKGWADIPQADRDAAKSIIGEGQIYKTQADYAKSYWSHYG